MCYLGGVTLANWVSSSLVRLSVAPASRRRSKTSGWSCVAWLTAAACSGGTLDAGYDVPRGSLPVDNRNPVVLLNDGPWDNWQGEYAIIFANVDGPPLAGIVIDDSVPWPDLADNMDGWQTMVQAARDSGLENIPDPVSSSGPVLVRPSDGEIDSTTANRSEGASFVLEISRELSSPARPLVVVTGGRLTDLADAYLMDHTVTERVVVVSALGSATADGGEMGTPNGDMDPWADFIVVQKFRYIQIGAFYEQAVDFPDSILEQLPTNPFTSWIESKAPNVWATPIASDQVAIFALAIPSFVSTVNRAVDQGVNADDIPLLTNDPNGDAWLVSEIDRAAGTDRLWEALLAPSTFNAP